MQLRRRVMACGLGALCCLLAGCSVGPVALPATRMDYNRAVFESNNEEMLLNIVRMRHFEQPFFLQVGSIASSFSASVTGSAGATLTGRLEGVPNSYAPSLSGSFSDSPTTTYTPFQGQAYVQQFLSEMDYERFLILFHGGWNLEYLLRIMVVSIGEVDHRHQRPRGFNLEADQRFREVVNRLVRMDQRGDLTLLAYYPEPTGGKGEEAKVPPVAVAELNFLDAQEAADLERLLGTSLAPRMDGRGRLSSRLRLISSHGYPVDEKHRDLPTLRIKLRNCLRAIELLSLGVEVPNPARDSLGGPMPYEQMRDLIDIRVAASRPDKTFAAVNHDGWWYYIRPDDYRSKEVFQLLLNIFALQAGDLPKNLPLLTLPVGGGGS